MPMEEQQVNMLLRDYVKKDAMAGHLEPYALSTHVKDVSVTEVAKVALQKAEELLSSEETKNKIAAITKSIVEELMQQEHMLIEEKMKDIFNRTERMITKSLEDSRQSAQDAKQSEEVKAEDETADDVKGEKEEDEKDKRINELEKKLKESNELNENKS